MHAPGDAIGSCVRSFVTFSSVKGTPSETEVDSAAVIRTPSALTCTELPNSVSKMSSSITTAVSTVAVSVSVSSPMPRQKAAQIV